MSDELPRELAEWWEPALSNRQVPLPAPPLQAAWHTVQLPERAGGHTIRIRAGIDTFSFAYRTTAATQLEWDVLEAFVGGNEPTPKFVRQRGGRRTAKPIHGIHVGLLHPHKPADALTFIEGRLLSLWQPNAGGLASLAALGRAEAQARDFLTSIGVTVGGKKDVAPYGPALLRRLDIAVDIESDIGPQLLSELIDLGSSCDRRIYFPRRTGRTTGISYHLSDAGVQARIYDRGSKSGAHQYGEQIRIERQLRYRREGEGERPALREWLTNADYAAGWSERFHPWSGLTDDEAKAEIVRRAAVGTISLPDAKALAGYLTLTGYGLRPPLSPRLTSELATTSYNPHAVAPLAASVLDACSDVLGRR